jgi:hypothetical protein
MSRCNRGGKKFAETGKYHPLFKPLNPFPLGFKSAVSKWCEPMSENKASTLFEQNVITPLEAMHRHDAYLGLTRVNDKGRWENLGSLTMVDLKAMFPALAQWLMKDAYFTVNATYRAGYGKNKITGLDNVCRGEKHLRFLNACYVDLDVGREDGEGAERLTAGQAMGFVADMVHDGQIPQPSLYAYSGRGLYVFWFLHDHDDPAQSPRAWPESLALYKRAQHYIYQRLRHLAADRKALDPARVLRIPGTMHGKAQKVATYHLTADAEGRPFTFTLSEIAAAFGVRQLDISLPATVRAMAQGRDPADLLDEESAGDVSRTIVQYGRETLNPGSAPARVIGAQVRHARCAQDWAAIAQLHGGWRKGRRRHHLMVYAGFLRGAGADRAQVLEAVSIMARECRPAYPSEPNDTTLASIVADAFKGPIPITKAEKLCAWTGITPELARELELKTIVPDVVRQERKPPKGGIKAQQLKQRREFIADYVSSHPVPSCRKMAEILKAHGIQSNHQTVNEDYVFFGFTPADSSQRRAGRPAQQPQLLEVA